VSSEVAKDVDREATNEPYKVESWTENGRKLDKLLYEGNLQTARSIVARASKGSRFTRLTIRHGKRVVDEWTRK
jgi:hypothetical protein